MANGQQKMSGGKSQEIGVVVAIGRNREIGMEGKLLWHIPDDLKRFKELTLGHPVIMGRKTWESLPEKFRPLPERENIVITRNSEFKAPGAIITRSIEEGLSTARKAGGGEKIFIIGGAEIYNLSLPKATHLYLTLIDDEKESDSFFPPYENIFSKKTFEEKREHNGLKYTWVNLERE
jgi:dihydrofolate reductase